jgi:hypothetical protein
MTLDISEDRQEQETGTAKSISGMPKVYLGIFAQKVGSKYDRIIIERSRN